MQGWNPWLGAQPPHPFKANVLSNLATAILLGAGTCLLRYLVPSKYTLSDVFFGAPSATSIGLSTGITSIDLSWGGKLILILLTWIERLEIIPVLLLLLPLTKVLRNKN